MEKPVLTNEQIMANRRKCVDFLKDPKRKKYTGYLENPKNSEERCCLGHMCSVLGVEKRKGV